MWVVAAQLRKTLAMYTNSDWHRLYLVIKLNAWLLKRKVHLFLISASTCHPVFLYAMSALSYAKKTAAVHVCQKEFTIACAIWAV